MPSKRFEISYPDGSKKKVGREERDQLVLGHLITALNANEYRYIGQIKTFHALSDLGELRKQMLSQRRQEPDYYAGQFIFELNERKKFERLQSAEALAIALPQMVAKLNEALV